MRFYKAMLRLYPASFRAEYEAEMIAVFAARRRRVTGLAAIGLWMSAVLDAIPNAARVHLDILRQDLRHTVRGLRRSPGYAAAAILMTSLGIGATTAAFSITDLVLIRPLQYPAADRLVTIWERRADYSQMEASPANYRDWKRQSVSFEAMGAYAARAVNLVGGQQPRRLEGTVLTADLFPMLGARPYAGRLFAAADDEPGASPTIVLSYALWQTEFGSDPAVLGRTVRLDDAPYTVVGVMRPDFYFPSRETQIWIPFRFEEDDFEDRDNNYIYVLGRLQSGTALDQARAEMEAVTARLERAYPKENAGTRATLIAFGTDIGRQTRPLLMALFGASLCVLLIACSNLASLLITRVIARRGELAVRAALGAGRERLVRQLLTESLVLSAAGAAIGLAIAVSAVPVLARLVPIALPVGEASAMDARVLIFAAGLTILTAILCAAVPAYRASGFPDVNELRAGARSTMTSRSQRLQGVLVAAQVAASVALLVSAGLLIRALWRVQSIDPGFSTSDVLAVQTPLPWPKYAPTAKRAEFYNRVLTEVRRMPGVSNAAYISFVPMAMTGGIWPVELGRSAPADAARTSPHASFRSVTPGFFATLGIPVLRGRDIRDSDSLTSPFVAVVSESFTRRHWPGQDPLGKQFKIAMFDRTIVGVVGDVRVRGPERQSEPQVYAPYLQMPDGWMIYYAPKELVVRSSGNPALLVPAIRQVISSADPDLPLARVRTLEEVVATLTAPRSTQLIVLQAFAALSLVLAGVGIHGLLAYSVSQRRSEIGLRLALGARSSNILRLVLSRALRLAATGAVFGLVAAYIAGRQMTALLAGVTPGDPATFLAVTLLIVSMTLGGSLTSALRALRVDAVSVMRAE